MPLSKIQSEVLRLLAAHRDPESYVAGSTPLNRDTPRFSGDIDMFHDRQERIIQAALNDAAVLERAGYQVASPDGHVAQPDPDRLNDYQTHAGQRRGGWPTSAEISTAMFERYTKPPMP